MSQREHTGTFSFGAEIHIKKKAIFFRGDEHTGKIFLRGNGRGLETRIGLPF